MIRLDARNASEAIRMDAGDQFAFDSQISASPTSYTWRTVGGDVLVATGTGITSDGTRPTAGEITSMTIDLNGDNPSSPDIVITDAAPGFGNTDLAFAAESFDNYLITYFNDSFEIFGSGFDDHLRGWGNATAATIYAGAGNDTVESGNGEDYLDGGAGNDVLSGGNNKDQLFGGAGNDNLNGGNDDDKLDGGDGIDILLGGNGNDELRGGDGADDLQGHSGNDYLDGGAGADIMTGSFDADTYVVDNVGDQVIEYSNDDGVDTVNAFINYTLPENVENLALQGSSSINGTGNNLANSLTGNNAANRLDGGSGADIMSGGIGSDSYYIDNAGDKVIEANVAGIDKVYSSLSYSISGQFIENLTLTGTISINGVGNSLANIIAGNAGNNGLYGLQGNDTLNGMTGQDILYGGLGNDRLIGGTGPDRFVFNSAPDASTNLDTITDFNVKDDNIWIDNAVFAAIGADGVLAASAFHLGAAAADAADRIVYNSATGALYYDADGSGTGAAIQFASLSKGLAVTNADFLII